MAPKCLPPELLFESVLFLHAGDAVPKAFSACWAMRNFLLPRVVKWKEMTDQQMFQRIIYKSFDLDASEDQMDPVSGEITSADGSRLTFRYALTKNVVKIPTRSKPHGLTLTELIIDFFNEEINAFGNLNDVVTLKSLLDVDEPKVLKDDVRECLHTSTGEWLTVQDAVTQGVVNKYTGLFIDKADNLEMPLKKAVEAGLIQKPRTLTELVEAGTVEGDIFEVHGRRWTLLQAIGVGIVDCDAKHIKFGQNGRTISVAEALRVGRLLPEGQILLGQEDGAPPGEQIDLVQARGRGILTDTVRHLIFDVKAFGKGRSQKSFNEVFEEEIEEVRAGRRIVGDPFEDRIKAFLKSRKVNAKVAKFLTDKCGLWDIQRREELSLASAVERNLLDSLDGLVVDSLNGLVEDSRVDELGPVSSTRKGMFRAMLMDIHASDL